MIAKRVPGRKATSSIARLARYVVNAQGGLDPRSWTRTADYILDSAAAANGRGEKVGGVRVTNCGTEDAAAATLMIEAVQQANRRSRAGKTYHLVFAFPPGERPALDVLHAIEDELCAAIGLGDHQRISAVHIDTDHLHVHVAINKVQPAGLRNIEPFFDKQKLMAACERLELAHGLQRTSHGVVPDAPVREQDEALVRFREVARAAAPALRAASSWAEAHTALSMHGLAIRPRGAGLVIGEAGSGLWMRASACGRDLSFTALGRRLGPFVAADQIHHNQRTETQDHERSSERGERIEPGEPPERNSRFQRHLRECYALSFGEPPAANTLNGLRKLSGCRLAPAPGGVAVLLPGDARAGVEPDRTTPADGMRWPGDGAGRSGRAAVALSGGAEGMERHGAVESLIGYVMREVAPALRAVSSWAEAHTVLSTHGLAIRPRGAGLVIGEAGSGLWTRASACGRDLSFTALGRRLGPFTGADGGPAGPAPGYRSRPLMAHPAAGRLHAQYQQERAARAVARRDGLARLRHESAAAETELDSWRRRQGLLVRAGATGAARKLLRMELRRRTDVTRRENLETAQARRRRLIVETKMESWPDWLARQATQGESDALALLRSREAQTERLRDGTLRALSGGDGLLILLRRHRPSVDAHGVVTYQAADGGIVRDRKSHVQVQKLSAGAALIALVLAADRFAGQALVVEGSEEFRQAVAREAGLLGTLTKVRFADPALEQARQVAAMSPQQPVPSPSPGSASPAGPALAGPALDVIGRWIVARTAAGEPVRLWGSGDAGAASFLGLHRLEDGSHAVEFRRGNDTLVRLVSPRDADYARRLNSGQRVRFDRHGRIERGGHGIEI